MIIISLFSFKELRTFNLSKTRKRQIILIGNLNAFDLEESQEIYLEESLTIQNLVNHIDFPSLRNIPQNDRT